MNSFISRHGFLRPCLEPLCQATNGGFGRGTECRNVRERQCVEFFLVERLPIEASSTAGHEAKVRKQCRVRKEEDERSQQFLLGMPGAGIAVVALRERYRLTRDVRPRRMRVVARCLRDEDQWRLKKGFTSWHVCATLAFFVRAVQFPVFPQRRILNFIALWRRLKNWQIGEEINELSGENLVLG